MLKQLLKPYLNKQGWTLFEITGKTEILSREIEKEKNPAGIPELRRILK